MVTDETIELRAAVLVAALENGDAAYFTDTEWSWFTTSVPEELTQLPKDARLQSEALAGWLARQIMEGVP